MAPAFIICEEGCLGKLFDPKDKYVTAKLFLEGQGLMVEQKCRHPKVKWRGVPVILTTNELPTVMRKPCPVGRKLRDRSVKFRYCMLVRGCDILENCVANMPRAGPRGWLANYRNKVHESILVDIILTKAGLRRQFT